MKNYTRLFLAAALLVPATITAAPYNWKEKALVATSLPIVGYGLYRAARWALGGEYSETMYARAQTLYAELEARYKGSSLIAKIAAGESFAETDLARVAAQDIARAVHAERDVQKLKVMRDLMLKRIERDKALNEPIIKQMQELADILQQYEQNLEKLVRFYKNYELYFITHQLVTKLSEYYASLHNNGKNKTVVRNAAAVNGMEHRLHYPLVSYAQELQNNAARLASLLSKTAQYQYLAAKGEQLLQVMQDALGTIINFPEYIEELHLKRQHELEQERIEAERRRAAAEMQRVKLEQERIDRESARARQELLAALTSGIANGIENARKEKARIEKERAQLEQQREILKQRERELAEKERREKAQQQAPAQTPVPAQPVPAIKPPAYNPAWQQPQQPAPLYPVINPPFNPTPAPSAPPMDEEELGDEEHLGD